MNTIGWIWGFKNFMRGHPAIVAVTLCVTIFYLLFGQMSCDKPVNPKRVEILLFDDSLEADAYCICWNQRDDGGQYVKAGGYAATLTAGEFDTAIIFYIARNTSHVSALPCCADNTYPKLSAIKPPPDKYAFAIAADSCAPTDTISFQYALPVASKVKVRIMGLDPI
jgi:hypothetical protein